MSSGAALDPKKRIVTIGGHTVAQRAKGTYVGAVYNSDQVAVEVGIDGGWIFKVIPDLSAVITVAVMPQSISNDFFSVWMNQIVSGLVTAKSLLVLEANGSTALAAARCMPVKVADLDWSDGTEVRSWSFATGRLVGKLGGIASTVISA